MHQHQIEPTAQRDGTFLGGACGPGREGCGRGRNRAPAFARAHVGYYAQFFGRGGVVHVDGAAVVRGRPAAIDEAQLAQQQGIFEFHA